MRILVTGATGLIGKKLTHRLLTQGHDIRVLTRQPDQAELPPTTHVFKWDSQNELNTEALDGCEAMIHLAGEPIASGRWTKAKKKRLWNSRILSTHKIVQAIEALPAEKRLRVLIVASAIGYYGDGGETELREDAPAGSGFLSDLVKEWEAAARLAENFGVRVVSPRFGLVLAKTGGALPKMGPAVLGSGRQWMSWVHIEDVVRFIAMALSNEEIRGVYNLTAPTPVRHRDFIRANSNSPLLAIVPGFILRMVLGEMAGLVLDSQKVVPERMLKAGFQFRFPDLKDALADIYK